MSRVLRRAGGAFAAAAMMFAVGACTADEEEETTPAAPEEQPAQPAQPAEPLETEDVPAAEAEAAEVPVVLVDDEVLMPATAFPAGTYTFVVEQEGAEPHMLSIEGPGVSDRTAEVAPGSGPEELTVTLEPGTYELWSSADGGPSDGASPVVIEVE